MDDAGRVDGMDTEGDAGSEPGDHFWRQSGRSAGLA